MKLLFTLIISLASWALFAQNQYATTSDGKHVLLKSNGTWEYVTTARNAVSGTTRTTTPTVQPRRIIAVHRQRRDELIFEDLEAAAIISIETEIKPMWIGFFVIRGYRWPQTIYVQKAINEVFGDILAT